MNKLLYKNVLVIDVGTIEQNKKDQISEIAWHHNANFTFDDVNTNDVVYYIRQSSKQFSNPICYSHKGKNIKLLSKIFNDELSDILLECDYIVAYDYYTIKVLLDDLNNLNFVDAYRDLENFTNNNKVIYIDKLYDEIWSYQKKEKLNKNDNLNRTYCKLGGTKDLNLDYLNNYITSIIKILKIADTFTTIEEVIYNALLNKDKETIQTQEINFTSKIVKLAVQINNKYLINLAIESHALTLIDPHVGFTYACSNLNHELVDYYLQQKYAPQEKYLRYINVDRSTEDMYKLFRLFAGHYFRIDDNTYETIMYLIHPINKDRLVEHQLNLDFVSEKCKDHFGASNINKFMTYKDKPFIDIREKSKNSFEHKCRTLNIAGFISHAKSEKPTEKCFENVTIHNTLRMFYFIHETYGYIPDKKTISKVTNECRRLMYTKFFLNITYDKLEKI